MHSSRTALRAIALVAGAALLPITGAGAAGQSRGDVAAVAPSGDASAEVLQIDDRLRDYDRIVLDAAAAAGKVRSDRVLTLDTKFGSFAVELEPHDVRASNYRAVAEGPAGRKRLERGPLRTYRGRALGLRDAEARFTIDDGRVEGIIIAPDETYFVEPATGFDAKAPADELIFYRQSDLVELPAGVCGASLADDVAEGMDFAKTTTSEAASAGTSSTDFRVVQIATEADNEYVTQLGGATAANNEILSILNQVEGVYQTELGLTFDVVYQHAWAGTDPYSGTASSTVLEQFRAHWNANFAGVQRDIAHMWTGRDMDGSTIGIAYTGVVCSSGSYTYGVSQRVTSAPQKYILSAHEIGHNFSAQHSDGQSGCSNTIMGSSVGTGFTFCSFSRNEISAWVGGHNGCLPYGAGSGGVTLSAPGALAATGGASSVSLTWSDTNSAEAGYRIERKTGATGTYAQIASVGANVVSYADAGRAAGTYSYRVKAFSTTADSAYSNEASATVGSAGATNLIANGTFESGATSWSSSRTGIINNTTAVPAFAGSWEATFGGTGVAGNSNISQAPAFPAVSTGSRTLTFYLRVASNESGSTAYDQLRVRVANSAGTNLTTLASFSNASAASYGAYRLVTLTVPSQYCVAGNRIRFVASEDAGAATWFSIDNVTLQ